MQQNVQLGQSRYEAAFWIQYNINKSPNICLAPTLSMSRISSLAKTNREIIVCLQIEMKRQKEIGPIVDQVYIFLCCSCMMEVFDCNNLPNQANSSTIIYLTSL